MLLLYDFISAIIKFGSFEIVKIAKVLIASKHVQRLLHSEMKKKEAKETIQI